jgi:hypothetical protein
VILLIGGSSAGLHDLNPSECEWALQMYVPQPMPSAEEIRRRIEANETQGPMSPTDLYERREWRVGGRHYTVWVCGSPPDSEIIGAVRREVRAPLNAR